MKLQFSLQIFEKKKTEISNFMKIHPVGAKLSTRTEGQTDKHDEANSRVSQFCERAEKLHANFHVFQSLSAVRISRVLTLNDTSADSLAGRHIKNNDKKLKKKKKYQNWKL